MVWLWVPPHPLIYLMRPWLLVFDALEWAAEEMRARRTRGSA